ncbi:MAG: hypothetical protein H6568_00370 [Lewinellaceae bacterium]|nr:hypothetical protein [Lewinellaceae bacterium]
MISYAFSKEDFPPQRFYPNPKIGAFITQSPIMGVTEQYSAQAPEGQVVKFGIPMIEGTIVDMVLNKDVEDNPTFLSITVKDTNLGVDVELSVQPDNPLAKFLVTAMLKLEPGKQVRFQYRERKPGVFRVEVSSAGVVV